MLLQYQLDRVRTVIYSIFICIDAYNNNIGSNCYYNFLLKPNLITKNLNYYSFTNCKQAKQNFKKAASAKSFERLRFYVRKALS